MSFTTSALVLSLQERETAGRGVVSLKASERICVFRRAREVNKEVAFVFVSLERPCDRRKTGKLFRPPLEREGSETHTAPDTRYLATHTYTHTHISGMLHMCKLRQNVCKAWSEPKL